MICLYSLLLVGLVDDEYTWYPMMNVPNRLVMTVTPARQPLRMLNCFSRYLYADDCCTISLSDPSSTTITMASAIKDVSKGKLLLQILNIPTTLGNKEKKRNYRPSYRASTCLEASPNLCSIIITEGNYRIYVRTSKESASTYSKSMNIIVRNPRMGFLRIALRLF